MKTEDNYFVNIWSVRKLPYSIPFYTDVENLFYRKCVKRKKCKQSLMRNDLSWTSRIEGVENLDLNLGEPQHWNMKPWSQLLHWLSKTEGFCIFYFKFKFKYIYCTFFNFKNRKLYPRLWTNCTNTNRKCTSSWSSKHFCMKIKWSKKKFFSR